MTPEDRAILAQVERLLTDRQDVAWLSEDAERRDREALALLRAALDPEGHR